MQERQDAEQRERPRNLKLVLAHGSLDPERSKHDLRHHRNNPPSFSGMHNPGHRSMPNAVPQGMAQEDRLE